MYPVSNTVKALFDAEQRQILRITGRDKNGSLIVITDANVLLNGFNVDRYSCNGQKIEVGTAIASQLTLKLNNADGAYDNIIFDGAELFVEIGVTNWSTYEYSAWIDNNGNVITDNYGNPIYFITGDTPSWVPIGYFTPDEQPRRLSTISIKALDRMTRFDVYVSEHLSSLTFPCTVAQLIQQASAICNVPFDQSLSSLPNYNYQITALPTLQQEITFRNLIQWCAGIMGTCAFIDWDGKLQFKWYSTANYISTAAKRYASDLYEDDITITGVEYTNTQGITIVSGTADYVLDMTGNYLAASGAAQILANIKNARSGFTYRPFSASVVTAPYLWPLDKITFTDKDGNNHSCIVTNVNFGLNSVTNLQGKGETDQMNKGASSSGATKEQAFLIEQAAEVTRELDVSLDQQGVFNRLTNNGETQGLLLYNGKVYLNAEYIQAGTIVANLLLASMLSIGGADHGNGSIQVKNSSGTVIDVLDKNGIAIYEGLLDIQKNGGPYVAGGSIIRIGLLGTTPIYCEYWSSQSNSVITELGSSGCYVHSAGNTQTAYYSKDYVALYAAANSSTSPYFVCTKNGINSNGASGKLTTDTIQITYDSNAKFLVTPSSSVWRMYLSGYANITGDLSVGGTKSRVVSTDQYSDRLLYCYETPSPLFGDVGEGVIGEDGKCYVWLDAVFADTISTTQYQVFLQRYGAGDCYVSERKGAYFVVEGEPGLAFGWEIKAKQRDFDQRRLDKAEEPYTPQTTDYGAEAAQYIDNLRKEREPV